MLVSGNFFNLFDQYYPLEPKVDLIITEMRNTRYRQPDWYRYMAGFAAGKPVVVVENPYGRVVPELIEMLNLGCGYDLFRLSLYEAAAHEYLEAGGRLLVIGELGFNLLDEARSQILNHAGTQHLGRLSEFSPDELPSGPQVRIEASADLALHVQRSQHGAAVHLIRYDYDGAADRIPDLETLRFENQLPEGYSSLELYASSGTPGASMQRSGDWYSINMVNVPLYCILHLT